MELSPETGKYLVDLGICTIGHLGVFANRLRAKRSRVDLYLEHIVSHSLRPLWVIGAMGLMNLGSETITPFQAALAGVAWGFIIDGVIPQVREKSAKAVQWDQLATNLIGTAIYLAIAHTIK